MENKKDFDPISETAKNRKVFELCSLTAVLKYVAEEGVSPL